jgi:hypothetical protein
MSSTYEACFHGYLQLIDPILFLDFHTPVFVSTTQASLGVNEKSLWFTYISPNSLLGQPGLAVDIDFAVVANEPTTSAGQHGVAPTGVHS